MATNWINEAHKLAADMETETSTHEGRKSFYRGDGPARLDGVLAQLTALRVRFEALVRHG